MSSLLRYKFKSAVDYEQLRFDGVCLLASELKRLVHEKRGDDLDSLNYDLVISDSMNGRGNFWAMMWK